MTVYRDWMSNSHPKTSTSYWQCGGRPGTQPWTSRYRKRQQRAATAHTVAADEPQEGFCEQCGLVRVQRFRTCLACRRKENEQRNARVAIKKLCTRDGI
jgi:hypothetical protein